MLEAVKGGGLLSTEHAAMSAEESGGLALYRNVTSEQYIL